MADIQKEAQDHLIEMAHYRMPFGKFKGMGIDEMEKDYMKKFVKYKRFTSNKGFMDRVRESKFSYLVKDKKKSSLRKPKKTVRKNLLN